MDQQTSEFLSDGTRTAKLATVRKDGRPHVAPIWYDLDGDEVFMNTVTGWLTERNIHRDPRVSMESR